VMRIGQRGKWRHESGRRIVLAGGRSDAFSLATSIVKVTRLWFLPEGSKVLLGRSSTGMESLWGTGPQIWSTPTLSSISQGAA
jgi:hypothetical protein